uniref:Uncharacterized protein n=1 Tax=Anguilla anguilla TaxID=7936 RepID=A0A0E9TV53_ANGAN
MVDVILFQDGAESSLIWFKLKGRQSVHLKMKFSACPFLISVLVHYRYSSYHSMLPIFLNTSLCNWKKCVFLL